MVFIGLSYTDQWNEVMGASVPRWPDPPRTINATATLVMPHPAAHGTTNDVYDAAGRALGTVAAARPPASSS